MPVLVAPNVLWASCQVLPSPGHHIERSTSTGTSDWIVVETAVLASSGPSWSTQMLNRDLAATVYVRSTTLPSGLRKRAVIAAGVFPGLAMSTNSSKYGPVAPSARNQLVFGAVTAALSWPAAKPRPGRFRYIARSTMIGWSLVRAADTSVLARPGSVLTQMLAREAAATV